MGKAISTYQLSMILRSPVKKVIIGLDDDAIFEAIKLGLKLVHHKKVKILNLPSGKDINDIGKNATKELEKSSPWLDYKALLKMRLKYEKAPSMPY